MKTQIIKRLVSLAGLASCLVGTQAFAGTIVGSPHDFSADGWSGGRICIACHTPHNGDLTVAAAPLWNHEVDNTVVYTLYTSARLDATDLGQPDGISKLCLSCHDGTVAVDSFGGAVGTTFIDAINTSANVGTNLRNDHPVSFTYDTALATADGALFDPATAASGLGGTIAADLLFNGRMECASCHDVHNRYGNAYLLNINPAASALCLTCHDK